MTWRKFYNERHNVWNLRVAEPYKPLGQTAFVNRAATQHFQRWVWHFPSSVWLGMINDFSSNTRVLSAFHRLIPSFFPSAQLCCFVHLKSFGSSAQMRLAANRRRWRGSTAHILQTAFIHASVVLVCPPIR